MGNPRVFFEDQFGISRITSLSDGVFSIVITLLVFDIKLPSDTTADNLSEKLLTLYPIFLSYIATFLIIGIYWVGHHAVFRHLRRYDRTFLWINLVFLLLVAFMPFPTVLLGRYGATQIGIVAYGSTLVVIGVVLAAMWRYATCDYRLIDHELSPRIIELAFKRILFAPGMALISIAVSFFSKSGSLAIFFLSAVYYFLPGRIDREQTKFVPPPNNGEESEELSS